MVWYMALDKCVIKALLLVLAGEGGGGGDFKIL
jgi:hypothetical protein